MSWFADFEVSLRGDKGSEDLVGAGSADAERSLRHYRYQHQAKLREAVEETFPVLVKKLGAAWNLEWQDFWQTNPICPRSLDFFPGVFLQHWVQTSIPIELKELARFEYLMDVHPWTHERLSVSPLEALGEDSKIILAPLDIQHFSVSVTNLYEEKPLVAGRQTVLLWLREDGLRYRALEDWEEKVLQRLSEGVDVALAEAPEHPEAISSFFQWLGQSGLIQATA